MSRTCTWRIDIKQALEEIVRTTAWRDRQNLYSEREYKLIRVIKNRDLLIRKEQGI